MYKSTNIKPLALPENKHNLLLHSCCAPCSGEVMHMLYISNIKYTIFFYNPNIHPRAEYDLRKDENKRFADKYNIAFVDGDYDRDAWFLRAKNMENEPERGIRCTMCFDMRFERTALYAHEHNFDIFTSCLGISRWKDFNQITQAGIRAAQAYPNLSYWEYNWRKNGGSSRMIAIAKQEQFYQQQYCGCVFSRRDTDKWRQQNGREKIVIGKDYYSQT